MAALDAEERAETEAAEEAKSREQEQEYIAALVSTGVSYDGSITNIVDTSARAQQACWQSCRVHEYSAGGIFIS